jgi:O-antigen/teichoic acid export membrane protein
MKQAVYRPSRLLGLLATLAGDPVRALSLAEQALISAANFLALLLLARAFDTVAFGVFSYAWLSLLFVVNLHRSAVVLPFVIHTPTPEALAAEAGAWRRLNSATALVFTIVLAAAALVPSLVGAPQWMARALLIAALLVGPSFFYEFRRRWLIQTDRYRHAVAAAGLYAALWLCGVAIAIHIHRIEAAAVALALAYGGAALFCTLVAQKLPGGGGQPPFLPFLARLRHFIGWSVMSNLAFNGYAHLPALLLGALAGPVPVAVYQAMRNFSQPLATLTTAIDNFDKPRAARAMALNGIAGLRRALGHTTAALAILAVPYLLVLVVWGDRLVELVYGQRYDGTLHVLWWFAALFVAGIATYPLETALFLLRRPDLLFRGRLVAAAAGTGLSLLLVPHWGVAGAMAAMIGGMMVSGIGAAILLAFLQLPQSQPSG